MRRKERETSREDALAVLDTCAYAVLSTINGDGAPYGVPLSIARKGDVLYFHCAMQGQKTENLRRNPAVCVTAVGGSRPLPEKYTMAYESAVAAGQAEEVADPAEKADALRLLCLRYAPSEMDAAGAEIEKHLRHTAVWKIRIRSVSGKRNA